MWWMFVLVAAFTLGMGAARRPWLWLAAIALAVGLGAWPWLDGAYDDSGHAVEFTVSISVMLLAPFTIGWVIGVGRSLRQLVR